jgi:hypothetical protein
LPKRWSRPTRLMSVGGFDVDFKDFHAKILRPLEKSMQG